MTAVSRVLLIGAALTLVPTSPAASAAAQRGAAICAIDMGSNSFRRIVGSFGDGRYAQRSIEVGDGGDPLREIALGDQ